MLSHNMINSVYTLHALKIKQFITRATFTIELFCTGQRYNYFDPTTNNESPDTNMVLFSFL